MDMMNNTDKLIKNAKNGITGSLLVVSISSPIFFFNKSKTVIYGKDQIRDGQTRNDWSIGIGIIGGFPDPFKKAAIGYTTESSGKPSSQK